MTVAELFVNLGVKGSEKSVGAIANVKKGLSETASMSLEAKAGIVAAMYALEKLFAMSGAAGTGLTNFNAQLGVSTQTLQKYQYAARQMGASNQEVESSFRSLQDIMTRVGTLGEGAPKGLARVAQLTGGITPEDIEKFKKNPEELIQRLQKYASKETDAGLRNSVLKSFNISDNMIAAMTRGAFRPDVLKKAPIYSDKEIGALDKANIAWSNLGNKIEMAIGHFNAMHGGQLVKDISMIVDKVLKLSEAFVLLAEKLKVFQLIGKAFEGWTKIFSGVSAGVSEVTGAIDDPKKREQVKDDAVGFVKEMPSVFKEMGKDLLGFFTGSSSKVPETLGEKVLPNALPETNMPDVINKVMTPPASGAVTPKMVSPSMPVTPGQGKTSNVVVNQNLNFAHEGKEHKQTADSVKKANQDAYRQFAQGQVN